MIFVKDFIMHYKTRYLEMIYIDIFIFLWVDIVGRKELYNDGNAVKFDLLEHYLISSFFLTFEKKNVYINKQQLRSAGFKIMIYTVFNIIQLVIPI